VWGSVSTGTKEEGSSIGSVWAAGFHNVTVCSRLADVFKLINSLILYFSKFFRARETVDAESVDTRAHRYIQANSPCKQAVNSNEDREHFLILFVIGFTA
jgi:hypothetical protein